MTNEISLLKDEANALITIGVGQSYATVSLGEWSRLIAQPRMYKPPLSAARVQPFGVDFSAAEPYHAKPEDCA